MLELLREYKEQMSVEQAFRFIKEPRHIGPVFLKRPGRIEAFAYVQAIALLIYTLTQKKIPYSLAKANRPLQVSWRGQTRNPTAQIILDMMERIQTVTARIGPKRCKLYTTISTNSATSSNCSASTRCSSPNPNPPEPTHPWTLFLIDLLRGAKDGLFIFVA